MLLRCVLPLAFAFITSSAHAGIETAREAYERKDYATALAEFHVLARRDNTEALAILSIMYLNGEGVPRDAQKAIEYATKLIALGQDQGFSLLATIYLSPKSGVRDKEKGLQYLRAGAEKKEENALIHLADLMVAGHEVPQDFETAFQHYEKAANRHASIIAAHRLGIMYEYGIGRPVDEIKALKWYESVPKMSVRPVPFHVASMYVRQAAIKERSLRRSSDLADAVALYRDAVKAGNGEAMHRLGRLYETGRGVPKDHLAAAVLYERGADAHDPGAMYSGGLLFEKGLGVEQSNVEAMTWFRQAAEAGLPVARRRLARAYDEGSTVAIDHRAATHWYCMAVWNEAAAVANPALRVKEVEPQPAQPLAEQLAILDQCASDEERQKNVRQARERLSGQLTPAIQTEADRLSKLMKATSNITKVLAAKG